MVRTQAVTRAQRGASVVSLVLAVLLIGFLGTLLLTVADRQGNSSGPDTVATYAVGDLGPAGGKIFYVSAEPFACGANLESGCTYLEASPVEAEIEISWATGANQAREVAGADGTEIGTGFQNSVDIEAQGGNDPASSAAVYANRYSYNGFTDWFLPAKDELNHIFIQRKLVNGNSTRFYWSSSEVSAEIANFQYCETGKQSVTSKQLPYRVRPIRAG